ncbi:MAG TPA: LysR family transcriptional regulator [Cellvibrionaceae bacterium]|nr:LysR family transcriptional regulator [Cellvibrionaceae bacterium]HMW48635.1 LysR family transcriptional regulator [Cellvibrionaceae bacterium]HMW72358.1 LysR family transcriptional regulator [Cellvibrionaceae bacterium]HMY37861.1 LysR family transcriptional regulator [Marinagarivorans sp.]HNG61309.1 LysR family transcriptional regulator [Cellvibrionaceae bacterium]
MSKLNYHHLYYFWRVAKQGNLTKTAASLHISQSALSAQIRQLEASLGVELFSRASRALHLTDSGQSALAYAEEIFTRGEELESLLSQGIQPAVRRVRIGVLTTMSRNFVESFIEPLIRRPNTQYLLQARGQVNLLNALASHEFDLALTNIQVQGGQAELWQCQLLARQPIAILGPPQLPLEKVFSKRYEACEWVAPVADSPIRSAFDSFCAQQQFKPRIVAEADDMAMLRLLARDTGALAVMPEVVVKDELSQGKLVNYLTLPNAFENFYAVTVKRQLPNPLVSELISRGIKL